MDQLISVFDGSIMQKNDMNRNIVEGLNKLGIYDTEQLIAIWAIESIRSNLTDYLAADAAQIDQIIENLILESYGKISNELLLLLRTPVQKDFGLGALVPEGTIEKEEEVCENSTSLLPEEISWAKIMPPIRDQGERGTCIAFSATALHEFFYSNDYDLSEQHLYYEVKQIDGKPQQCGSSLRYAAQVLTNTGQCREDIYQYNPNQPCNNHGNLPDAARTCAAGFKMATQTTTTKNISRIKESLSKGNIVSFSIPVYDSWYRSQECYRTGRITLPIPGEGSVGGHAMCFIGYKNDSTFPGGGYFIFRNSWGTSFGYECIFGVGNGIIPYDYLTNYAWEAINSQDLCEIRLGVSIKMIMMLNSGSGTATISCREFPNYAIEVCGIPNFILYKLAKCKKNNRDVSMSVRNFRWDVKHSIIQVDFYKAWI